MPIGYPGNSISKEARAKAGGGFESAISGSALAYGASASTVTITTDGTYNFGSVAPIFVCNLDAANASGASRFEAEDTILGQGCTIDTPDGKDIEVEPKLVGGKGIIIGTNRADLNGSITGVLNIDHPATRKCFESRTTYMPRDHAELAVDYRLGNLPDPDPEGSSANDDWQIKPVWNAADRTFTGEDTDFFFTTFERYFTSATGFSNSPRITSNSVAGSIAELTGSNVATDTYQGVRIPLDEPYTMETGWDQGPIETSLNQGTIWHQVYCSVSGIQSEGTDLNVNLAEVNGTTKEVNGFGYPGFIRGFSKINDNHLLETQVYRQIGDGRYCRVAICNNADYFASTQRILLPPASWSESEIQANLPLWSSGISDFVGFYVCVVDINNNQIGTGLEIT